MLFAAGLLFWSSLAALLPTLPLYIGTISNNSQTIGVVMGAFAVGLLMSRSYLARLADSRGRKIVLLIGMTAVAVAPLGYLLTDSISWLIAVRMFHGLSIAAFALAYSALVVDLSPSAQRGELIGYMSLVNPIGMGFGPALGGLIYETAGFTISFGVATAVGLIGLVCTTQVREPAQAFTQASSKISHPFWRLLWRPHIRTPALVLLLIGLSFGTLTTFVPLLVRETGVNVNVGLFYSTAAIAGFGIRLLVGRASDQYGRGIFISISLVLYALSMAILWQASSAPAYLVGALLEGAGAGTLIPMMAALMADRSRPDERGRTFSLCMVGFDLGIAIAGPVLGAIADQSNYQTIFGLASGLSILGLLVFLTLSSKTVDHSLKFALGRGRDVYAVETLPHKT